MNPSLYSYEGDWQASSGTNSIFYDNGDGSGRLHVYDGSDPNPLLWDNTKTSTAPFACSSKGAILLKVWVALEESVPDGVALWLEPTNDVLTYTSQPLPFLNDRKLVGWSVQIFMIAKDGATPWSLNQSFSWQISSDGNNWTPVSGSAPLEVYGICQPQPQFFLNEGIPIELLRLFIPASLTDVKTEQDWIDWVTNVCHGKQDPKGTPGQLRLNSTQHWLRYNVWDGQFSFIDESGGQCSLMGWVNTYLDHQRDPTKTLRLVNCFDQAAIVETVLGLGISYKRLHWEVMAPFGYIDGDLTGWGSTNSPFFEGDTQNIKFKNVADPMRTPFRSHVFITISPTETAYVQSESLVVDACAGPVAGGLTYTEYLDKKALHDGIKLLEKGRSPPKKPWSGVETTTGTLKGWTLNDKLESLHPDSTIHVSEAFSDLSAAFASNSMVSDDFNAETVINAIFNPILSNKGPGMVLNDKSTVDTTLNDSTIVPGASTTKLSVAGQVVGGSPTFISFQISEFSGGLDDALSGLQKRFSAFTLPTAWVKDKKINIKRASTSSDKGIHDSRAMIFGTYHLDLFLYKNLVVQIAGNSNSTSDALLGWTKDLWAELCKY